MTIDGTPTHRPASPAEQPAANLPAGVPEIKAGPVIVIGADPFTHVGAQWLFSPLRNEDGSITTVRVDWSPQHHPSSWLVSATVTTLLPLDRATELMIRVMKL